MERKHSVVILGGGESGTGAALLAKAKGFSVFLSDSGPVGAAHRAALHEAGIDFEEGGHNRARVEAADEVVKSPGIPNEAPIVQAFLEKGISVISEIEFAARFTEGTLIGITGTNGKTTTTRLIYHLLKAGGLNAGISGNVGNSFAREVIRDVYDYYVLELSSFQLDNIQTLCPHIAILLNITPDHLDRYGYQMKNYIAAKMQVGRNQGPKDYFLFNADDRNIAEGMQEMKLQAQQIPIFMDMDPSDQSPVLIGGHSFFLANSFLKGRHNRFNARCAIHTALLLGVEAKDIQMGLDSFVNDPHRMEIVEEWQGVQFINDSKATNIESVFFALEAMTRPVIWIAGGTDKGNDYEPLAQLVEEKVKGIVCLGVDNHKLHEAFGCMVGSMVEAGSATEAVAAACRMCGTGDVVLLSPACASFDRFRNYEDRGEQFKRAVREYIKNANQ